MQGPLWSGFVVVGSGIAGLRTALVLGCAADTLILTKDAVSESAAQYAQGGIAAALGEDDTVSLHEQDTINACDGLCDERAVRVLVEEASRAIGELLEWGAGFDRVGQRLERTREAAHSRSRILHAHGDSTGREIAETLARRVGSEERIRLLPHTLATRLLWDDSHESIAVVEFLDVVEERPESCTATPCCLPPAASLNTGPATLNLQDVIAALRRLMWDHAGIIRDAAGLTFAQRDLDQLRGKVTAARPGTRLDQEGRNLLVVAQSIVRAALARTESRGAHYRHDFPGHDRSMAGRHSYQRADESVYFDSDPRVN